MSVFRQALNSGLKAVKQAAGTAVTYQRESDTVALTAVPGESVAAGLDRYGFIEETRSRDYLIDAADLKLGGVAIEPEAGDLIKETIGGQTLVFEVMSPGGDTPAWRWSDRAATRYRIHTKQIGTARYCWTCWRKSLCSGDGAGC